MKNIDNAIECLRTHILKTGDTVSESVEKFYSKFEFTQADRDALAKSGLRTLTVRACNSPSRPQYTRTSELEVRSSTVVEKLLTGNSTSTVKTNPRVTTKPSKHLTNILEQVLFNVAFEGPTGRRTKLIDFTRLDCQHYNKNQSFVIGGIERKCQVMTNIESRLKHYSAFKVADLSPREQTAIAREWRNAENGVESAAFSAAVGV
jgi:hypothetical protein